MLIQQHYFSNCTITWVSRTFFLILKSVLELATVLLFFFFFFFNQCNSIRFWKILMFKSFQSVFKVLTQLEDRNQVHLKIYLWTINIIFKQKKNVVRWWWCLLTSDTQICPTALQRSKMITASPYFLRGTIMRGRHT